MSLVVSLDKVCTLFASKLIRDVTESIWSRISRSSERVELASEHAPTDQLGRCGYKPSSHLSPSGFPLRSTLAKKCDLTWSVFLKRLPQSGYTRVRWVLDFAWLWWATGNNPGASLDVLTTPLTASNLCFVALFRSEGRMLPRARLKIWTR